MFNIQRPAAGRAFAFLAAASFHRNSSGWRAEKQFIAFHVRAIDIRITGNAGDGAA